MNNLQNKFELDANEVLPEQVPVTMPNLPTELLVTTAQQFKAIGDETRSRILGIIQNQPATAKQIADRLKIAPGTIGHHLQVLEEAGLAQVVARRLVRGIVAKYYTRTARIFSFKFPPEVKGSMSMSLDILTLARDELAESLAMNGEDSYQSASFPHARLSPERVQAYKERISQLVRDLLNEPYDPDGEVYGFSIGMFLAPPYLQVSDDVDKA